MFYYADFCHAIYSAYSRILPPISRILRKENSVCLIKSNSKKFTLAYREAYKCYERYHLKEIVVVQKKKNEKKKGEASINNCIKEVSKGEKKQQDRGRTNNATLK